ncbi:MAG: NnrS family protein, partial [Bdellovibrionota bacterium]
MPNFPITSPRAPLWSLGFRPFFLAAALLALVSISLWALVFLGELSPFTTFNPLLWHAHEMVYGYTAAVIAGFLLTASQNWTGIKGVNGARLMGLVVLWTMGRLAMASPFAVLAAVIDLSFFPVLAWVLTPYLRPTDMKAERIFYLFFALYLIGNFLMHAEVLGIWQGHGLRGAHLGLNASLVMIVFMGGRVIPFFTESERSKRQPRTHATVEVLAHLTAWGFLLSQFWDRSGILSAVVAFAAAFIHLIRLKGWYVRRVRRVALLGVLYIGYLWLVLGFFLAGLHALDQIASGPVTHA